MESRLRVSVRRAASRRKSLSAQSGPALTSLDVHGCHWLKLAHDGLERNSNLSVTSEVSCARPVHREIKKDLAAATESSLAKSYGPPEGRAMRTKKGFQTWELLRHGRVNVSSSSSFGPSIAPRSEAAPAQLSRHSGAPSPWRVLKCYVELGAKTMQIEHVRKSSRIRRSSG